MYFKVSMRTNPETDIHCGYYRLVESYRNHSGRVCHRTLIEAGAETVSVTDNKKQKIGLCRVKSDRNTDYYLKVEIQTKAFKECSMNEQLRVRFEEGLQKIAASLTKKGGVKQDAKVHERIGRLRQKYPSIQRYFDIKTEAKEAPPFEGEKKVASEGDDGKRIIGSIK